jgi:hypothetical protein
MDGTEVFGLTTPLLTTADGAKMGKTAAGAVWLNEDQLPAYDFWQYWRNVDDRDVGKFLRLFTDLPLDEIARLEALEGAEINAAKVVLANEVTALVRGADAAHSAEATAARLCRRRRGRGPARARPCPARRHAPRASLHRGRLHRLQRRGQAQDRRGRGASSNSSTRSSPTRACALVVERRLRASSSRTVRVTPRALPDGHTLRAARKEATEAVGSDRSSIDILYHYL